MDARELRIGNLVEFKYGTFWKEVLINGSEIHSINMGKLNARPIPLTEEWLLKAGFDNNGRILLHDFSENYKIYLHIDLQSGYVNLIDGRPNDNVIIFINDIKDNLYVHTIQNIFFGLKQTELEFKEQ